LNGKSAVRGGGIKKSQSTKKRKKRDSGPKKPSPGIGVRVGRGTAAEIKINTRTFLLSNTGGGKGYNERKEVGFKKGLDQSK